VSRPRRGAGLSGQIASVMLRALAAEVSDPGRFRRATDYASDGAVLDLEVHAGELRVLVRGSRFEPYLGHVCVDPAEPSAEGLALVPRRDELDAVCTCPDDSPYPGGFCKHAVAAILVLSERVADDPALLAHWRAAVDPAELAASGRGRRRAAPRSRPDTDDGADVHHDVLTGSIHGAQPIPDLPTFVRRLPVAIARHDELGDLLADTLADALAVMR
jgi:uncharacterized Zn finger protein